MLELGVALLQNDDDDVIMLILLHLFFYFFLPFLHLPELPFLHYHSIIINFKLGPKTLPNFHQQVVDPFNHIFYGLWVNVEDLVQAPWFEELGVRVDHQHISLVFRFGVWVHQHTRPGQNHGIDVHGLAFNFKQVFFVVDVLDDRLTLLQSIIWAQPHHIKGGGVDGFHIGQGAEFGYQIN